MAMQARFKADQNGPVPEPADQSVIAWGKNGLAKEGELLFAGALLRPSHGKEKHLASGLKSRHDDRTPAVLQRIEFKHRSDVEWAGGVLEYELELPLPVKLGDKLMGRRWKQGVVGNSARRADAIFLIQRCLPVHLRGKPIDLSPESRMASSQDEFGPTHGDAHRLAVPLQDLSSARLYEGRRLTESGRSGISGYR